MLKIRKMKKFLTKASVLVLASCLLSGNINNELAMVQEISESAASETLDTKSTFSETTKDIINLIKKSINSDDTDLSCYFSNSIGHGRFPLYSNG